MASVVPCFMPASSHPDVVDRRPVPSVVVEDMGGFDRCPTPPSPLTKRALDNNKDERAPQLPPMIVPSERTTAAMVLIRPRPVVVAQPSTSFPFVISPRPVVGRINPNREEEGGRAFTPAKSLVRVTELTTSRNKAKPLLDLLLLALERLEMNAPFVWFHVSRYLVVTLRQKLLTVSLEPVMELEIEIGPLDAVRHLVHLFRNPTTTMLNARIGTHLFQYAELRATDGVLVVRLVCPSKRMDRRMLCLERVAMLMRSLAHQRFEDNAFGRSVLRSLQNSSAQVFVPVLNWRAPGATWDGLAFKLLSACETYQGMCVQIQMAPACWLAEAMGFPTVDAFVDTELRSQLRVLQVRLRDVVVDGVTMLRPSNNAQQPTTTKAAYQALSVVVACPPESHAVVAHVASTIDRVYFAYMKYAETQCPSISSPSSLKAKTDAQTKQTPADKAGGDAPVEKGGKRKHEEAGDEDVVVLDD